MSEMNDLEQRIKAAMNAESQASSAYVREVLGDVLKEVANLTCNGRLEDIVKRQSAIILSSTPDELEQALKIPVVPCGNCITCIAKELSK